LFELNFHDERYLPFEGAGAISRWRFELPPHFRQFDYNTISDLVLHIRYTARDAGATLRNPVIKAMNRRLASDAAGLVRMFSLRHEFPNEWQRFRAAAGAGPRTIVLPMPKERFPFFTARGQLTLVRVRLLAPGAPAMAAPVKLTFAEQPAGASTTVSLTGGPPPPGEHPAFAHAGTIAVKVRDRRVDEWRIELPIGSQAEAAALDDIVLLCEYKLALPE
jgi:hypothetical protein